MATRRSSALLPLTPVKHAAESLPGYAFRVAETNGLDKLEWLPLNPALRSAMSFAHCVAMDGDALAALEQMSGSEPGSLLREQWRSLESATGPYVGLWGEALPADAMMMTGAQVCPRCLDEPEPFLHADWDFSLVTVCTRHRCRLIAECPSCGAPLRWSRPRMAVCGRCAADLRRPRTLDCSEADVVLSDFAAAVAHFTFIGKSERLEPPEALFELARLFSLSRSEFLKGNQQRHFARLSLAARHEAAIPLAACIVQRKVAGELAHQQLMDKVSHIHALLGPSRARSRLFRLLANNDFLSMPVRRFLAFAYDDAEPMRAAELFGGRPPRLFTLAQARKFVGCPDDEFDLAVADGTVRSPERGLAFDVDHLLDVQRRVRALLSADDIDASFGVRGLCGELLKLRILKSERRVTFPVAVSVENYERVLDQLLQLSDGLPVHARGKLRLGDVKRSVDAGLLASLIARVLNGGVVGFYWEAPWGWRDMSIDERTWELFTGDTDSGRRQRDSRPLGTCTALRLPDGE